MARSTLRIRKQKAAREVQELDLEWQIFQDRIWAGYQIWHPGFAIEAMIVASWLGAALAVVVVTMAVIGALVEVLT